MGKDNPETHQWCRYQIKTNFLRIGVCRKTGGKMSFKEKRNPQRRRNSIKYK